MALALMTQPALAQPYPTAAPTSFAMPSSGYTVADLADAPASESEFTLTMLAAWNVGQSELRHGRRDRLLLAAGLPGKSVEIARAAENGDAAAQWLIALHEISSEERGVGQACVTTCRAGWA